VILLLMICVWASAAWADTLRTQTITLNPGWNAVYLEVEPAASSPSVIMTNTPVDIVANFFDPGVSPQFISNPSVSLFKLAGWGVWYAESRPDAFLKSLHALYGRQAYLVHATSPCSLNITGTVIPAMIKWTPDAFNFVGFSVSASSPPTFAQFFAGSPALRHNKIYRLVNSVWRQVTDPAAELMRSGESFWIYCSGSSTYQGPLRVETTTSQGIVLGRGGDNLVLRNESSVPIVPTLEHVASGADSVPLMVVVQVVGGTTAPVESVGVPKPDGSWSQSLPTMEAATSLKIPLEARVESMTLPVHKSLLKISTDIGSEVWIPVIGVRADKGAQ
jgi:hypothetical protein